MCFPLSLKSTHILSPPHIAHESLICIFDFRQPCMKLNWVEGHVDENLAFEQTHTLTQNN